MGPTSHGRHVGADCKRLAGGASCIWCTHQQLEILQSVSILSENRNLLWLCGIIATPNFIDAGWRKKTKENVFFPLPLLLARTFLLIWLGHTVKRFLEEVFSECLGHLSQRVHWKSPNRAFTNTNRSVHSAESIQWHLGVLALQQSLTSVPSLAVDAFLRGAADSPVPVHKEAVAERVAKPLHGGGNTAAGGQAGLAGAAQEHALSGKMEIKNIF